MAPLLINRREKWLGICAKDADTGLRQKLKNQGRSAPIVEKGK